MKINIKIKVLSFALLIFTFPFIFNCGDSDSTSSSNQDTGKVEAPLFYPVGGEFSKAQKVKITSKTDGAFINYTIDGSEPDCTENGIRYEKELSLSLSVSLKAIACKNWMSSSSIINENYKIGFEISGKIIKSYDNDTIEDQIMSHAYIKIIDIESREETFTIADYFGKFSINLPEGSYYLNAFWNTSYNPEFENDGETQGPYDSEGFFMNVNSKGQTRDNAFSVRFESDKPEFLKANESINIPITPLQAYFSFSYNSDAKLSGEKLYWDALDDSSGKTAKITNYYYNSDNTLSSIVSDVGSEGDIKIYSYNDEGLLTSINHFSGQKEDSTKLLSSQEFYYDNKKVTSVSFDDRLESKNSFFRRYEYNENDFVNKITVYSETANDDIANWTRTVEYIFSKAYFISSMSITEPGNKSTFYSFEKSGENFITKKYKSSYADSQNLEMIITDEIISGDLITKKIKCYDSSGTCKNSIVQYNYENNLPVEMKFYNENETLEKTWIFTFDDFLLSSLANDIEGDTTGDFFLQIENDENRNMIAMRSYASQTAAIGIPYVEKKWSWQKYDTTNFVLVDAVCSNNICETGEDSISCPTDCISSYSIPTNGLVAYYPFNGNANDESPNSFNGTTSGGLSLSSDRFGNGNSAYYFNGTDSYIQVNPISDILTNASSSYSIACWVKISTAGIIISTIDTSSATDADYPLNIRTDMDDFFASASKSSVVKEVYSNSASYNDSKWHFIVFIVDKNVPYIEHLYIDNVQIASTLIENVDYIDSGELRFGASYESTMLGNFFSGEIDDIRIYNRVLSTTEITALYNEAGWTGN